MRVSSEVVSVSTATTGQVLPAQAWWRDLSESTPRAHSTRASLVSTSLNTFSAIHGRLILSAVIPASFSRNTERRSLAGFGLGTLGGLGSPGFLRGFLAAGAGWARGSSAGWSSITRLNTPPGRVSLSRPEVGALGALRRVVLVPLLLLVLQVEDVLLDEALAAENRPGQGEACDRGDSPDRGRDRGYEVQLGVHLFTGCGNGGDGRSRTGISRFSGGC